MMFSLEHRRTGDDAQEACSQESNAGFFMTAVVDRGSLRMMTRKGGARQDVSRDVSRL